MMLQVIDSEQAEGVAVGCVLSLQAFHEGSHG